MSNKYHRQSERLQSVISRSIVRIGEQAFFIFFESSIAPDKTEPVRFFPFFGVSFLYVALVKGLSMLERMNGGQDGI